MNQMIQEVMLTKQIFENEAIGHDDILIHFRRWASEMVALLKGLLAKKVSQMNSLSQLNLPEHSMMMLIESIVFLVQ